MFDELRIGMQYSDVVPQVSLTGVCDELDEACYLSIVQNFHQFGISPGDGDLNGDGKIDLSDLRIWRDNRTDVLLEISNVPEPSSSLLLSVSALIAMSLLRK